MNLEKINVEKIMNKQILYMALAVLVVFSESAYAYIGPGLGAGTVAIILGILVSIVLGILAVFWYPIKRFYRNLKGQKAQEDDGDQ